MLTLESTAELKLSQFCSFKVGPIVAFFVTFLGREQPIWRVSGKPGAPPQGASTRSSPYGTKERTAAEMCVAIQLD